MEQKAQKCMHLNRWSPPRLRKCVPLRQYKPILTHQSSSLDSESSVQKGALEGDSRVAKEPPAREPEEKEGPDSQLAVSGYHRSVLMAEAGSATTCAISTVASPAGFQKWQQRLVELSKEDPGKSSLSRY